MNTIFIPAFPILSFIGYAMFMTKLNSEWSIKQTVFAAIISGPMVWLAWAIFGIGCAISWIWTKVLAGSFNKLWNSLK